MILGYIFYFNGILNFITGRRLVSFGTCGVCISLLISTILIFTPTVPVTSTYIGHSIIRSGPIWIKLNMQGNLISLIKSTDTSTSFLRYFEC